MSHAEADDADAKPTEAFEFGRGDQISISVKSGQPKCARTQNTDHRPAPGIVNPPDRLGARIVLRRRSKPLQSGLLLPHCVDELDPCVGPQLPEEIVVDGILGVEDYSIALVCVIDA
jgi:hypothetical protein